MPSFARRLSLPSPAHSILYASLLLAILLGLQGPVIAQVGGSRVLPVHPDTSSAQAGSRVEISRTLASEAITGWEPPEPGEPRWWTDPANRPHAVAEVLEQVLRVPLGSPWMDWRRRRESPNRGCVTFQGETTVDYESLDHDLYWIYRCAFPQVGGTLEFYAYLLGGSERPTIDRVRWTTKPGPGLTRASLIKTREAILAGLRTRRDLQRGVPSGAFRWNDPSLIEGWEIFATPLGHLRLGFTRDANGTGDDSLLVMDVWGRALLRDEATADSAYQEDGPATRFAKLPLPEGTQSALNARWPDLARALRTFPRSLDDLPAIRRSIDAVRSRGLQGHPKIALNDRARVLYAATHWVWAFDDTSDTTVVRRIETSLGPIGLKGEWGHYDGTWHPSGSLLRDLVLGTGSDPWSDRAFLYFQETGWETNAFADSGGQFFIVIDRGERFLRDHPRSTEWVGIALTVASAHETAWSLAKASPEDEYVDPTLYVPEAPAHRARAIQLYEEILRRWDARSPDSRTRNDVRHRLIRLRLDVDTATRAYYPTSC